MLTTEQVAERRLGLGGSDAAAVLGVHPYRAPIDVWLDKVGLAEPWAGNESTLWGDLLEPVIAAEYARRTGRETARTERLLRHPKHPWMIGNPDRILVGANKGLEIKTAGFRSIHRWGEEAEDCPEEYIVQCCWYMAISGCEEWDLVVLLGGQQMRIYTIQRDRDLEDLMIEAGGRFWVEHVLAGVQPTPDGSESFRRYLAGRYPRDSRPLRAASAEEVELAERLRDAEKQAQAIESQRTELQNRLKASIAEAGGIFADGWKVLWKANKNGQRSFRAYF